jgi:oligosaccharyltransferase complex subunit gamma
MLSGYMWVKIRNPPFVGTNHMREILYIANSPQAQLGIESRIVSGLNAAIVVVFLLISPVTYKLNDNNKRRIAAMVMSLLYMAGHAGLLKAFMQKFPGYPLSYIF